MLGAFASFCIIFFFVIIKVVKGLYGGNWFNIDILKKNT
jgi:hypothetical protein